MAQLIVRNIEDEVVAKLRERAARRGTSTEEEHRRVLREAVLPGHLRRTSLKDHLRKMPSGDDDRVFERPRAKTRPVDL
jgi:antitoxin FitA